MVYTVALLVLLLYDLVKLAGPSQGTPARKLGRRPLRVLVHHVRLLSTSIARPIRPKVPGRPPLLACSRRHYRNAQPGPCFCCATPLYVLSSRGSESLGSLSLERFASTILSFSREPNAAGTTGVHVGRGKRRAPLLH
jgi:hypothetical protein